MPENNRPLCPLCDRPLSFSHSLKSGAIAYRCRRKCRTDDDKPVTVTIGDRAIPSTAKPAKTPKERRLAWKKSDPVGYAKSQKQRQERMKERDPVAYTEKNRLRQARYRAKKRESKN
jgi:hypothetical protein